MSDMQAVEQESLVLVSQAKAIAIQDVVTFRQGGVFLQTLAAYVKTVVEVFDPMVDAAHKSHKTAVEQRKKMLAPAEEASKIVRGAMVTFEQTERNRVAEEQRAADAERRRQEDEERLRNAERLEQAGKPAAAERALTAPATTHVITPPVRPAAAVSGVSFRDDWDFEIRDATLIPREFLIPDEKAIRAFVKAHRDTAAIPGVKVLHTRTPVVRL